MKIKFKNKIWKMANSHVITIPAQYIKDGILYETQEVEVSVNAK